MYIRKSIFMWGAILLHSTTAPTFWIAKHVFEDQPNSVSRYSFDIGGTKNAPEAFFAFAKRSTQLISYAFTQDITKNIWCPTQDLTDKPGTLIAASINTISPATAIAIWSLGVFGNPGDIRTILLNKKDVGITPTTISTNTNNPVIVSCFDLDPHGICIDNASRSVFGFNSSAGLVANRFENGTWLNTPDNLNATGSNALSRSVDSFSLDSDGAGNTLAVWVNMAGNVVSEYMKNNVWQTNDIQIVSDPVAANSPTLPQVAMSKSIDGTNSGNALCIWSQDCTSPCVIKGLYYNYFDVTKNSWTIPELSDQEITQDELQDLSVVMNANGDGFIFWIPDTDRDPGKVFARFFNGKTQQLEDTVQIGLFPSSLFFGSIAIDGDGNGIATWRDASRNTVYTAIYVRNITPCPQENSSFGSGGQWLRQELFPPAITGNPTVRMSHFSYGMLSFKSAQTERAFSFTKLLNKPITMKPITTQSIAFGTEVEQLFNRSAMQGEYFNRISWQEDPDASGYSICRNGTPIARVAQDVRVYIDHNRSPNREDTYQVNPLNEGGELLCDNIQNVVRWEAVDPSCDPDVIGYNIYKDGERVSDIPTINGAGNPGSTLTWVDPESPIDPHTYIVVAVCNTINDDLNIHENVEAFPVQGGVASCPCRSGQILCS